MSSLRLTASCGGADSGHFTLSRYSSTWSSCLRTAATSPGVSAKSPPSSCPAGKLPWAVTRIPCTTASAFVRSTMPGRFRSISAFSPVTEKTRSGLSLSTGMLTLSPATFTRSGSTWPSSSFFQFRDMSAS